MSETDDFRLLLLGKITSAEYVRRLRERVAQQRREYPLHRRIVR